MNERIALISPVYQNYDILQDFFTSLKKQKNKNFKVFVADLSPIKKQINSQGVNTTVLNENNLGYAHGVNVGVKKAISEGYSRFCVLNNDTFVGPDFINNIIKTMDKNPSSLIGGKIYYAKGYEYHKDRYQKNDLGNVFWYAGGIMDWANVYTKHRGVDLVDKKQYEKSEETEFITGCLICFDKKVWDRVGAWDESYFLYYEDADYCQRAKILGFKLLYEPKIIMWHKVSQSTGGSGSSLHMKYQEKNRLTFGLKYAPLRTKLHLLKNYFFNKKIKQIQKEKNGNNFMF